MDDNNLEREEMRMRRRRKTMERSKTKMRTITEPLADDAW